MEEERNILREVGGNKSYANITVRLGWWTLVGGYGDLMRKPRMDSSMVCRETQMLVLHVLKF